MPKERSRHSSGSRFFGFVWRVIKFVLTSIFLFVGLFIVIVIFQTVQKDTQTCEETSFQIVDTENYQHNRSWKNLDGSRYCMNYTSIASTEQAFAGLRNDMEVPKQFWSSDEIYWGYIYRKLLEDNDAVVNYIADSLLNLANEGNLSRYARAQLMVSFVQDIPYVLITNKPCEADYTGPCRANEAYGILSPYEFLYSLEGDCDTRSVLLYALLKRAGFRPIIVVSEEYAHAMIALDINTTGDYIEYKRQKFYFWETTSQGWQPGMLPPSSGNKKYWNIALAYEF